MKAFRPMTAGAVLFSVVLVLIAGSAWGAYTVRISDLQYAPTPTNPIRVAGKISSTAPLRISDGRGEIAISGLTANMGDFLSLEGNWDGTTLAVSQSPCRVIMYSPFNMVYVPGGSFDMGTPDSYVGAHDSNEHPQHSVDLTGYWIGKYEVTRGEYRQFMNATGRTEPSCWAESQNWGTGTFTQTDSHPVVGVTYYDAEAFCNWAGGHLPTEAQWEKAARWTGSHPNVYPWGDSWDEQKCNNFYDTNMAGGGYYKCQTAPVGSYPLGASPYGCQDMSGNVWEWCQDWFKSYPDSTSPFDYTNSYRAYRGGSWYTYYGVALYYCADRHGISPAQSADSLGFRLAR
jgi:sulfatase modifying factor 1